MALSELAVKTAKSKTSQYKLFDSNGLFMIVKPSGGKLWRFKYRFAGKEQQLSLGKYPDVGLREARDRCYEARKQVGEGFNPAALVRKQKVAATIAATNTFSMVAEEYLAKREKEGLLETTLIKNRRFVKFMNDDLGHVPITEIEPVDLLHIIKKIEKLGLHETAKRTRALVSKVYRFAIASGRAKTNPAADTLLNESGKWHPDAIELALAHQIPGMVRGIYHRGKHLAARGYVISKI